MNCVKVMNLVRYTLLPSVLLTLAAGSVRAQGVYEYSDDFAGKKAQVDCWRSSIFWPSDINNPPARPYLSYRGTGETRGLVFMDYQGELAQLEYRFLFGAMQTGTLVRGTLQVDVSFPCTSEIAQFPPGQLFYSTSPDGQTWSAFLSVGAGHQEFTIQFTEGVCHVQFRGARAMIDNLRVSPSTPGMTLRASQNSAAGLTSSGSAPSILHVDGQSGRDWNDGKSRATAFATVQKAINDCPQRRHRRRLAGRVPGGDPVQGQGHHGPKCRRCRGDHGPDGYAFSFYDAEGAGTIVTNFVIAGCGMAGIFCDGSSPTLRNLTITGNQAGIVAYGGANPYIVNSIIWGNTNGPCRRWKNFNWQIYYSCIDQSNPEQSGGQHSGPIRSSPIPECDYHLKSQWGRYVPWTDTWGIDNDDQPVHRRRRPGGRSARRGGAQRWLINMGAYGGTPYASCSSGPLCK